MSSRIRTSETRSAIHGLWWGPWVAVLVLIVAYLVWAGLFIRSTSFVAIDGGRYYSLFDDAMISMRYGWNLAHGYGLVWNPGEHVEGYTNLLLTLIMAISTWIFDKSTAVLAIQVFGALTMVGIALSCGWIARELARSAAPDQESFAWVVGSLIGLIYFPLNYWALMGMETGLAFLLMLLALGWSLVYRRTRGPYPLLACGAFAGLAYLTRPDTLVLAMVLLGAIQIASLRGDAKERRRGFLTILLYLAFPLTQLAFRLLWYGQVMPNTYILKVEGIPLVARLTNGWSYQVRFLAEVGWVLAVGLVAGLYRTSWQKLVLVAWIALGLVYQVWVGGDAWDLWRMVSFTVPVALILIVTAILEFAREGGRGVPRGGLGEWRPWLNRLGGRNVGRMSIDRWIGVSLVLAGVLSAGLALTADRLGISDPGLGDEQRALLFVAPLAVACGLTCWRHALVRSGVLLLIVLAGLYADRQFADTWMLWERPPQVGPNQRNVNIALALSRVTTENASVGVFWAGTIPYYSGRYAVDFLGKTDPYIAGLPGIVEADLIYTPGHNKCDLKYSIVAKRPTYVQGFAWYCESVLPFGREHYVPVSFQGVRLDLLRDSDDVNWNMVDFSP